MSFSILKILNKPFPKEESRFCTPKTILTVSLFVVFVLYIFQPFGIAEIPSRKFLICLGFGIATFLSKYWKFNFVVYYSS